MNLRNALIVKLFLVLCVFTACQEQSEPQQESTETATTIDTKEKLLRHVVIFKFKDESSEEDVNRLNQQFISLGNEISVVKDFEWGINDSPENFHQGFTHCYLLTFASEKDRDSIYAPHPLHKAFGDSLQAHMEKVFVVDYWTNP